MSNQNLFKQATFHRILKKSLPKETTLNKDASQALHELIETITYEIIQKIKKQPYRTITGYMMGKECQKYLLKQETLEKYENAFDAIKQTIETTRQRKEEP